jgi:MFS family permease
MSNVISAEPKPQAPQAAPDGNAIASLILGIVGLTVLPFIGSILAVIFGHISTRYAYRRGERGSAIATAGVILGWIGVAALAVFVVFFAIFTLAPWWIALAVVILGISAWFVYYTRRNNRR